MIYLIGQAPASDRYEFGTWEQFTEWATSITEFELDIETTVSDWWNDKKIITIQFGYSLNQWVLHWSSLSPYQQAWIKEYLEDSSRLKLIQNAQFEYIVLRFHGIEIDNVYDTMVAEKIITAGIENTNYAMGNLTMKYLGHDVDKTEQTTFGDDILTENKVLYAATDVQVLTPIRNAQLQEIKKHQLERVIELEMTVVLCLGEMTYYGMLLDTEKWIENAHNAQPFVDAALERLHKSIKEDSRLCVRTKKLGFLSDSDRITWNLNSPKQKLELLQLIFPDLRGATAKTLQSYIRNNPHMNPHYILMLMNVMQKEYSLLSEELIKNHREYCLDKGYIIPAGTITINWGSPTQALGLLTAVEPKLKATNANAVANASHPIFEDLVEYKQKCKMLSQYGLSFIEDNLEPDGRIRTSYNQAVSTGRLSSTKPNMQNIPVRGVGNTYLNCFYAEEDYSFVTSDYVSAESIIITFISKDEVWYDAVNNGYDLHSVCAELVFGQEWKRNAEESCTYFKVIDGKQIKQKCSCKKHKPMRDKVKTISFG